MQQITPLFDKLSISYKGDLMFGRIFKSITFDNGVEFNCHKEIETMRVKVYFTHPYSSYERGANENFNGLVRRFCPREQTLVSIVN